MQLKLTCFDILNQNTTNYWGNINNTPYYSNSLALRQYFLLLLERIILFEKEAICSSANCYSI